MKIFCAGVAVGVLAGLAACGVDNAPCTTCAPVEGTWAMTYQEGSRSNDCDMLSPPTAPGSLTITRQGAFVATLIDGEQLRGTLYDTGEFVLKTGAAIDAGAPELSVRGVYLPPGGVDGGVAGLRGTFSSAQTKGARTCSVERPYTASKN